MNVNAQGMCHCLSIFKGVCVGDSLDVRVCVLLAVCGVVMRFMVLLFMCVCACVCPVSIFCMYVAYVYVYMYISMYTFMSV